MASIVRFYGLSWNEVNSLTMEEYNILSESMEVIEAREQLLNFESSMASIMKEKSRSDMFSKYEKRANKFVSKKVLTTDELLKLLGDKDGR